MEERKFDVKKLDKLNNPERLKEFPAETILKLANINNPKTLIDLGAGTGFFSIPFAKKIKDSKIYACDISEVMIDWMKEHITNEYDNIIPLKMEENSIPLENEIADFLFMVNLHHELNDPEKTLTECYRLLKPKGKIAISDWKKENTSHGPSINFRYNTKSVEKQLLENGFHNISLHTNFPNNFLIIGEKNI